MKSIAKVRMVDRGRGLVLADRRKGEGAEEVRRGCYWAQGWEEGCGTGKEGVRGGRSRGGYRYGRGRGGGTGEGEGGDRDGRRGGG